MQNIFVVGKKVGLWSITDRRVCSEIQVWANYRFQANCETWKLVQSFLERTILPPSGWSSRYIVCISSISQFSKRFSKFYCEIRQNFNHFLCRRQIRGGEITPSKVYGNFKVYGTLMVISSWKKIGDFIYICYIYYTFPFE